MMEKKKINIIDAIVVIVLVLSALAVTFALLMPTKKYTRKVVVAITSNNYSEEKSGQVYRAANRIVGKEVYFDSTLAPVRLISAERTAKDNGLWAVTLNLESTGEINSDRMIFNGLRVYSGQKAEVHSNFVVKGIITKIEYGD